MKRLSRGHYEPEYDPPMGYCAECGQYGEGYVSDEGIGPYEYWGYKGVHHDYVTLSVCCDADLLDHEPKEHENGNGVGIGTEESTASTEECGPDQ